MAKQIFGRRFYLSSGYKLFDPALSPEVNQSLYGDNYSPKGIGFNFEVDVRLSEEDTKLFERAEEVIKEFDHRLLNDCIEGLPTLENITQNIFCKLKAELPIFSIRLRQGNEMGILSAPKVETIIYAKMYSFSSLHRHHNPELTEAENQNLFGKCAKVHGHEYKVWIYLEGPLNKHYVVHGREKLDKLVVDNVVNKYHGKMINELIGNTSGELLLQQIMEDLKPHFSPIGNFQVSLIETSKNSFFTDSEIDLLSL